jgi:hypothetical protein
MILLGMFKSAWPYKRSIRRKLLMGNRIFNYRNRDFLQTVIQFSYVLCARTKNASPTGRKAEGIGVPTFEPFVADHGAILDCLIA